MPEFSRTRIGPHLFVIFGCLTAGCAAQRPYELPLMPAPDIYAESLVEPFADISPVEVKQGNSRIPYVTDRAPDSKRDSYTSDRGHVLRAGIAIVELGEGKYTWDEVRQISLLKNRTEEYPIRVTQIEEFGILPESLNALESSGPEQGDPAATDQLVAAVQAYLDRSRLKEINIYQRAARYLAQKLDHEPSPEEVASLLDKPVEDVKGMLGLNERVASVDAPLDDDPDRSLLDAIADERTPDPEKVLQRDDLQQLIQQWLNELKQEQAENVTVVA